MFTQQLVNTRNNQQIHNYMGVDLTTRECYKLQPHLIYSNYSKEDLHYPIGAIQKGLKPHTKIGIKRLNRKNLAKKLLTQKTKVLYLNPKSPQDICLKVLRTTFRYKLEQNHRQIPTRIERTPKIIRRKEHQSNRRSQLMDLLQDYRQELLPHFGDRLEGFRRSKCPKVSRKQIKDYLLTLGIVPQVWIPECQNSQNTTQLTPLFAKLQVKLPDLNDALQFPSLLR